MATVFYVGREERLAIDFVIDAFRDAKTYGSCLQMTQRFQPKFYEKTARRLREIITDNTFDFNLEQWAIINQWFPLLIALLEQADLLSKGLIWLPLQTPLIWEKRV